MRRLFFIFTGIFIVFCYVNVCASSVEEAAKLYSQSIRDLEKAQDIVKDILQHDPQNKEALLLLGKILFRKNKIDEAFEIFSQLEKNLDEEALYYYGIIHEKKNLFLKAKKIYKRLILSSYREKAKQRLEKVLKIQNELSEEDSICKFLHLPPQEKAQECGAEILLVDEEIEITPQNTQIYTLHFIARIVNQRGKDLGEIKIEYDSTYERILSLEARTITAEGKIIKVGKENIRDVSKYLEFPLYSNARVRIISMPQAREGSLIEYSVKIKKIKLVNKKDVCILYSLQDKYPIKKEIFKLIIPKFRKLNIYTRNTKYLPPHIKKMTPNIYEQDGKKV